jgi:hypothetical protein
MDYMPIDWFCEMLAEIANIKSNEIINIGSGLPMPISSITSLKKLPYVFHEERWQDDRRIDFGKFKGCSLPALKHDGLEKMIKEYVLGGVTDV